MINLNLREVLKQTSNLSARKNGSHVDLSYNLEAEIEVICIPEFDQFPFNRHTCHVNVSHKCGNVRPIQPCFKVTSWTKTEDQLIFVANKTLMPMKPPEMILFDYGLTVSYLTGKGSVGPQCPMHNGDEYCFADESWTRCEVSHYCVISAMAFQIQVTSTLLSVWSSTSTWSGRGDYFSDDISWLFTGTFSCTTYQPALSWWPPGSFSFSPPPPIPQGFPPDFQKKMLSIL